MKCMLKGEAEMADKNINLDEWYTSQEAAEKLGLTKNKKYVHVLGVQYGKFRTYKLGDRMLYRKEDVDAYQVQHGQPGRHPKQEQKAEEAA